MEEEPVVVPIDGELDLHTFRPSEVSELVQDYLAECLAQRILRVRIVHGKGTGALRATVHAALDRCALVANYRLAGPGEGSWGATIVHLCPVQGITEAVEDNLG